MLLRQGSYSPAAAIQAKCCREHFLRSLIQWALVAIITGGATSSIGHLTGGVALLRRLRPGATATEPLLRRSAGCAAPPPHPPCEPPAAMP
eukprot:1784099-Prymnesium_polylepis.1